MHFPTIKFNKNSRQEALYESFKSYYPDSVPMEGTLKIFPGSEHNPTVNLRNAIFSLSTKLKKQGFLIRKTRNGYCLFPTNGAPPTTYTHKRPYNDKITGKLLEIFKTGAKLSSNEIMDLYWPGYTDKYSTRGKTAQIIRGCRTWLRRENKFLGIIDGRYQVIDESTYSREANRRYTGIAKHFNNVNDLIISGIEQYKDNTELANQLELLILNLQDINNSHRRRLLNPSSDVSNQDSQTQPDQTGPGSAA